MLIKYLDVMELLAQISDTKKKHLDVLYWQIRSLG